MQLLCCPIPLCCVPTLCRHHPLHALSTPLLASSGCVNASVTAPICPQLNVSFFLLLFCLCSLRLCCPFMLCPLSRAVSVLVLRPFLCCVHSLVPCLHPHPCCINPPSPGLSRLHRCPDLCAPLMCRRHGSMREYVQRDDLELRARCGGALARQAGGAATCVAQPPQPHNPSNSQHTATAHPRRLLGSAPNSVEISSIGGTMDPQRIGALRSLDPRQSLKTFISGYKAPTARAGILASNKHYSQQGLVQASLPCKLERRPTLRTASPGPRAKYRDRVTTADRLIGVP